MCLWAPKVGRVCTHGRSSLKINSIIPNFNSIAFRLPPKPLRIRIQSPDYLGLVVLPEMYIARFRKVYIFLALGRVIKGRQMQTLFHLGFSELPPFKATRCRLGGLRFGPGRHSLPASCRWSLLSARPLHPSSCCRHLLFSTLTRPLTNLALFPRATRKVNRSH